jgi:hypothetical protein
MYGEGISKTGSVLDAGVDNGLVEKSGTWYTYKSERIGQGRENARSGSRNAATFVTRTSSATLDFASGADQQESFMPMEFDKLRSPASSAAPLTCI